jgi:hypothetical protein
MLKPVPINLKFFSQNVNSCTQQKKYVFVLFYSVLMLAKHIIDTEVSEK